MLFDPPLFQLIPVPPPPPPPPPFQSIAPELPLPPPPPLQLTPAEELDPPQFRAAVLDSVVTGVLNKSARSEYLSPPTPDGALLAGGAAVWAGEKLANPPFTTGAALTGALDTGNSVFASEKL